MMCTLGWATLIMVVLPCIISPGFLDAPQPMPIGPAVNPNNARGIEWYAHMYGNGLWNDAGDTNADRPFWPSNKVFSCACQVSLSQVSE